MKIRCSPYNPLAFLVVLGIFIFGDHFASAQCQADFAYQAIPADKGSSTTGKIEITAKNPESGTYTFKVYKVVGKITLVHTKEASNPDKIIFEGLEPSTYYVKIEWGQGCYKTIGGLTGILIMEKSPAK